MTKKEEQFETLYRVCATDVYRVCLHYLKDEEKARTMAQKVFFDLYYKFEEIEPEYYRAYLITETKKLISGNQNFEAENKEVRE